MKNTKIYDAIDMIQIILNEIGIKKLDGSHVTFDIVHLGRLPKSKFGFEKVTEKAIGFELNTNGYLLEPQGVRSDNELYFDIGDAPLSVKEIRRIRGAIQKLYDEKVIIVSDTKIIYDGGLDIEEDEEVDLIIKDKIEKYGELFK